jgi:hypothetical protein
VAVKDAMLMAASQKLRNVAKSIVFIGLLPRVIQALYSSAKRPMRWMTQIPILTMSLSGMGCLARLPGTGAQQGVQIPVMDAIPRPWQCNQLCKQQQMCGHILHEPGKHLAKDGVRIFHPDLFVQLFEGNGDEVKENLDEGGVHVDDVVSLECHVLGDFDIGTIVGVGAPTVVGNICNFRGKWIV